MRRLFLYVPSLGGSLTQWEALKERLAQEPGCEGGEFRHWPVQRRDRVHSYSRGQLANYGLRLAAQIDEWDRVAARRGTPYDQIVLLGNSLGTLLVRWAWLHGSGAFSPADRRPWSSKVRRIVLVAGINRGFSIKLGRDRRNLQNLKIFVFKLLFFMTLPFGFVGKEMVAGSPFVTTLRLTWMRFVAHLHSEDPDQIPEVVQLLGSRDDLVRREDSRDVEQFPRAAHVTIAGASHSNVLDLSGPFGADRYTFLSSYILESAEPTVPPSPEEAAATDVVFVVHGIRAGVYDWVTEVRRLLSAVGVNWRVVTPTYRFFSALAFAFPVTRHRKISWFLDQYSREVAKHPTANFHFVGHSFGTYLLGQALQQVPAVRFQHVYIAGSVLPADYPWRNYLDAGQVISIRSDRASRDFPVALLAQGLRGLGMRDVGGGGFEGFADLDAPPAIQWPFFPGGHGAPLATPTRRKNIVSYVTKGVAQPPHGLINSSGGVLAVASRLSPVLLLTAFGLSSFIVGWAVLAPGVTSVALAAFLIAAVVGLTFL